MIDRKSKLYPVVCPKCFITRKVTYAQSWNIKTGNSSGKCQSCVTPENGKESSFKKDHKAWNEGKTGYRKGHPCYYKAFGPEEWIE